MTEINIYGTLNNATPDGVIAKAEQIKDSTQGKKQSDINADYKKRIETLESGGGTGSGGTTDYTDLTNKPQINGHELSGNKSSKDLGLQQAGDYALKSEIPDTANFATKEELNSITPTIGENGNWFINGEDTGEPAKGRDGADGVSLGEIALVQETGTESGSENKVMSQKAVSEKLTELSKNIQSVDNYKILDFTTDVETTRNLVPENERKYGLIITYNDGTNRIIEQFNFINPTGTNWTNSNNWNTISFKKDIKYKVLTYSTDVSTTRKTVSSSERSLNLIISYKYGNDWITEKYINGNFSDSEWVKDTNWIRFAFDTDIDFHILNYTTDKTTTRLLLQEKLRKTGTIITYNNGDDTVVEQYIGSNINDSSWKNDNNWKSFVFQKDLYDISLVSNKNGRVKKLIK